MPKDPVNGAFCRGNPLRAYGWGNTRGNEARDAVETFIRREGAERFVEEVRGDEPALASYLRIEERELDPASGLTAAPVAEAAEGLVETDRAAGCSTLGSIGH